jgi:hypothetical protein
LPLLKFQPSYISALDWQVRFVKLEKRVDLFCFTYKLLVQTTKIFILLHSFRRACWDSLDLLTPLFLLRLFPQTSHCYISAPSSSVHSATFVGNATEATCRVLRIPFQFDSHEWNPKSAQLFPPNPKYTFSLFLSSNCKSVFRTARPCSLL